MEITLGVIRLRVHLGDLRRGFKSSEAVLGGDQIGAAGRQAGIQEGDHRIANLALQSSEGLLVSKHARETSSSPRSALQLHILAGMNIITRGARRLP